MRPIVLFVSTALLLSAPALAKPGTGGSAAPAVAYVSGSGNSVRLMVADESGSNASALYTSPTTFRFDLGPRNQHEVAINGRDGTLRLLTYTESSTGTLTANGTPVALTSATSGTNVDFSPDGRRIAYACCDGGGAQKLMVYDLDAQTATQWANIEFLWDVAFFRGGSSIAVGVPSSVGQDIIEFTSPSALPRRIFQDRSQSNFDSARTNPDALVLDYHDAAGNAYVGLWQAPVGTETDGHFLTPNLTNRSIAFFGTLNCSDQKLAYMSSTTPSGGQVFFIRNLVTAQDNLFAKASNMQLQFWPTCS